MHRKSVDHDMGDTLSTKAIENKLYMYPLSNKEIVALLLTQLLPTYINAKEYKQALAVCNLTLKYYPDSVDAIVNKGSIYYKMLSKEFELVKNGTASEEHQKYVDWLREQNIKFVKQAFAMGYVEETDEEKEEYVQEVKSMLAENINE